MKPFFILLFYNFIIFILFFIYLFFYFFYLFLYNFSIIIELCGENMVPNM